MLKTETLTINYLNAGSNG